MNLSASDYALAMLGWRMAPLLRHMGELETYFLRARLRETAIDRPVFIAGLARSGTTVLLNLLSRSRGVATHRYRDFPFLCTPFIWNWFLDHAATQQAAIDRPHRDRIQITKESPEAYEEPIWQMFFPWLHDPRHNHILGADTDAAEFEAFFCDHIRKILLIRGSRRYVSKGNYNLARFGFLAKMFPDALFIVPVRSPLGHVHSLVKQHRLFTDYAREDGRVPDYLRAAGHYEFGPQRQPISLSRSGTERVLAAWQAGDDYRGYAALWAEIYAHVGRLTSAGSDLAKRILVIRYEDFCADPRAFLGRILDFAQLTNEAAHLLDDLDAISAPPDEGIDPAGALGKTVQAETEKIASAFGY